MLKKELEKHYLATTYCVFIEKKQYDINIEQPLPNFIEQLVHKQKTAAILTAWNPRSLSLTLSENQSRNNQLIDKLSEYTIYKSMGQGEDTSWPAEESFLILGINKAEVDKLAIEFEQYAYVWIEEGKHVSLIFSELWNDKF